MSEKDTAIVNFDTSMSSVDEDRYSRGPGLMIPINDSSLSMEKAHPTSPLHSPVNPYTLFDDPVYAKPKSRKSVKKSTLERAKQHHLQKSGSLEKLLDDEEEGLPQFNKSVLDMCSVIYIIVLLLNYRSLEEGDEPIYGNMNFHSQGSAGNRWEDYWKTATVMRGGSPPN